MPRATTPDKRLPVDRFMSFVDSDADTVHANACLPSSPPKDAHQQRRRRRKRQRSGSAVRSVRGSVRVRAGGAFLSPHERQPEGNAPFAMPAAAQRFRCDAHVTLDVYRQRMPARSRHVMSMPSCYAF